MRQKVSILTLALCGSALARSVAAQEPPAPTPATGAQLPPRAAARLGPATTETQRRETRALSFDFAAFPSVYAGPRRVEGPLDTRRISSVRVGMTGENAITDGLATSRGRFVGALGGGGDGFEGRLVLSGAGGVRLPLGDSGFGPFARLGAGLDLEGSRSFYRSSAEFPRFETGLLLHTDAFYFELAGSLGHVLNGFFNMEDAVKRRLGPSPAVGAAITAGSNDVGLTASARRAYADRSGIDAPVDQADVALCADVAWLLLCVQGSGFRGDVRGASPPNGIARVSGLSLGAAIAFGDIALRRGVGPAGQVTRAR